MSLYAVTARNLRPPLMQILILSNNARPIKSREYDQHSVQGLKGIGRMPAEAICIPVTSFAESGISQRKSVVYFSERVLALPDPATKYSDLELETKSFAPFLQNSRWYAEIKTPSDEKAVIKDSASGIARLGGASEDGFFHKMNKARLEQIKKMLRDKNKLKSGSSPPTPKD